ncbi:hypothetical protein AB0L40_05045 [Patulibacter sp. NPDC049589]|uniref:hypothetical protein n=1 Tax=Patulibacter sp. NPDC049589 TaxID=3154731 RepID=UPI00343A5FF9
MSTSSCRIAVLALSLLIASLVATANASAGQYTVRYCADGAAADRWTAYATAPGSAAVECSALGRVRVTMAGTQYWGEGSTGVLSFTAPDGTMVAGWQPNLRYHATKFGEDSDRFRVTIGPVPYRYSVTTCINTQCPAVFNGPVAVDPPAQTVEARVTCVDERADFGSCRFESELLDYGGTLTLQDDHPPTARTVDGAITNATTPKTALRGTSPVHVAADDVGSGVWKTEVRDGATVLAQAVNGCVPQPTASTVPCRTSQETTLDLDSTKLTDGAHQLAVVGVDASGNETTLWSGSVVVVNSAIGPGSPLDLRGDPTGSDATDNVRVTASWPATAYRPPKRCRRATYRKHHRKACRARAASQTYRGSFAPGRSLVLTGRVSNTGTRDAITGAPVQVRGDVLRGGAAPWTVAATTDPTGRWRVKVPRDMGARQISVRYFSRQNDTRESARTSALLLIRAKATLRAVPKRARAGGAVRFVGQLADRSPDIPVVLEAYSRGRYRTFATTTTRTGGRFSVRYRLGRGFRGSYRFRARVQPTRTTPYPYVGAPSNPVTVRVRR